MNWATIQTALITAVQTSLGDLSADVGWTDREARYRAPAHVRLSVLANVPLGRAERRYTDEGSDDIRERVYGPRRLVVSFRCETRDQDLISSALQMAEDIAAGLHQSDVEAILDTAGIGVAKVEKTQQINAPDGKGKVRSVVVLDVRFNVGASKTGPLVPYVKAVEVEGTIENGPNVGPFTVTE